MLLTIGHSTHSIERFLDLLTTHGVTAIADVRSSPYSRFAPQFSKNVLKQSLRDASIAYTFLGKGLGARSENLLCYKGGKVQYSLLAQEKIFAEGVSRVMEGMKRFRIALMCAEKDPMECHRALLVARHFYDSGIATAHIHADGSLELHEAFESRLLTTCKLPEGDMFKSRNDFVSEAYAKQGDRIAYQDDEMRKAEAMTS